MIGKRRNGEWREPKRKTQFHNAKELTVRHALLEAWRNTAPKRLVQQFDNSVPVRRG